MADQAMDDAAQAAIADTGTGDLVTDDSAAAAGPSSPNASGAGPQDIAITFNPELYAFEHKGQRILPKDENQVRQWLSGGYNFSQNQAAFKKQQAEVEERSRRVAEYEKLAEAFEKNPQFQKQIMDWYQKSTTPQAQAQPTAANMQLPPELLAKLEKVDAVSQDVQRMKEKEEDSALEQEIAGLKSKYKDYDWTTDSGEVTLEKQVLQAAMDNGLNSLEKAFKLITYDKVATKSEAAALSRLAAQKADDAKKGVVSSAGSSQKPAQKPIDHSNTPYNKLAEMAAAEIT